MISKITRPGKQNLPMVLLAAIVSLISGCNSGNYQAADSIAPKSISQIMISETDDSWNCIIKGNSALTFSAINQVSPAGILLYFPNTTLDIQAAEPFVPDHEIISSIEANEIMDGNLKNSRILIGLNRDRPYSISPAENGLKISFPKTLIQPLDDETIQKTAETNTDEARVNEFPPARLFGTVAATALANHVVVEVKADGTIAEYDSFTIDDPARIVFDIYHIKSPRQAGQTIAVDSKWVKRIRYKSYPDKIRVVLDTQKQYLTQYFSFPTGSGLLIYVGQMPQPLKRNE